MLPRLFCVIASLSLLAESVPKSFLAMAGDDDLPGDVTAERGSLGELCDSFRSLSGESDESPTNLEIRLSYQSFENRTNWLANERIFVLFFFVKKRNIVQKISFNSQISWKSKFVLLKVHNLRNRSR